MKQILKSALILTAFCISPLAHALCDQEVKAVCAITPKNMDCPVSASDEEYSLQHPDELGGRSWLESSQKRYQGLSDEMAGYQMKELASYYSCVAKAFQSKLGGK